MAMLEIRDLRDVKVKPVFHIWTIPLRSRLREDYPEALDGPRCTRDQFEQDPPKSETPLGDSDSGTGGHLLQLFLEGISAGRKSYWSANQFLVISSLKNSVASA